MAFASAAGGLQTKGDPTRTKGWQAAQRRISMMNQAGSFLPVAGTALGGAAGTIIGGILGLGTGPGAIGGAAAGGGLGATLGGAVGALGQAGIGSLSEMEKQALEEKLLEYEREQAEKQGRLASVDALMGPYMKY